MFSVSRSLAVFTLPSPPIVSGASQICFISMQPARRTFLAPIIEVCLVLGVAVVLGAPFFSFKKFFFEKAQKGFDPLCASRTHPALLAVLFPQISPPYCGPLA